MSGFKKVIPGAGLVMMPPGMRIDQYTVRVVDPTRINPDGTGPVVVNALDAEIKENIREDHFITLPEEDPSELFMAIRRDNFKEVLRLIKQLPVADRIDYVNQCDAEGNPMIHCAVYYNADVDILTLLLDYGANPNRLNNTRNSALHLACQRNHLRAIKTLIHYGADPLQLNWEMREPAKMVPQVDQDKMVHYVKYCVDSYAEQLETQSLFRVSLHMRSYYRSVFDDLDLHERGYLFPSELTQFLERLASEEEGMGVKPAPQSSKAFFKWWIRTPAEGTNVPNGIAEPGLTFADFLHGITVHYADLDRRQKKLLQAEKRRKQKEEAAAAGANKYPSIRR